MEVMTVRKALSAAQKKIDISEKLTDDLWQDPLIRVKDWALLNNWRDGSSRLWNYLSSSETELRFMEDLTLKITVEYNIRSENENADFDQRGFPSRFFPLVKIERIEKSCIAIDGQKTMSRSKNYVTEPL
jgi:hypothetical protein